MAKAFCDLLLVLSTLLMLQGIRATVIFHNEGTTLGWDRVKEEHNGVVELDTSIVYESSTAIKCTQTYDPSYSGRYHSEVAKNNIYRRGDMGFYSFMFRLADDWEFEDQNYNIAQFIADFSDTHCDGYIPTTMIWIYGTKLWARTNAGPVCPSTARHSTKFTTLTDVTPGEWHKVTIQANWQTDSTGFFKMWYDGEKFAEKCDFPTTLEDDRYFQFRVGLYANGWHDNGHILGSQGVRSVWFDEIGIGTTFSDSDPDQW